MQIGVNEFIKDFNKLNADLIEVIDKKTNELKGVYLTQKEALKFKSLLKKEKKKQERFKRIMKYAGEIGIDEKFQNLDGIKLKEAVAKEKMKNL